MHKSISSELENSRYRKRDGYTHFRASYFTNISFKYKGVLNRVEMKVDTGASRTIIGLEYDDLSDIIKKDLYELPIIADKGVEDASGSPISIRECEVDDFRLTKDIIISKIKIYFSSNIRNKAVLGMDILSLFDFQYKHEKGNMLGTFWINNYQEHMQKINEILKRKGLNCWDTEQIFLLAEPMEERRQHKNELDLKQS